VRITKLHMEEDAGKTRNEGTRRFVDFNRCGVPLVEMVTDPDLHTADEAALYLTTLRQLLRWIGVSEADMEKAHLRCDANVSIRPKGATYLNPKTEIKNVNSIEAVRSAIIKEIERQIHETEAGNRIESWTLEWDEDTGKLLKMRSKETEADYRYFREPDLLSLPIDDAWKNEVLKGMPELPLDRKTRFIQQYGLPVYDADVLTSEKALSDYFEETLKTYKGDPKKASNWLMNDVLRMINDRGTSPAQLKLTPAYLGEILTLIDSGAINNSTGKKLLEKVETNVQSPAKIVEAEGLTQVSDDSAIRAVCQEVLVESPKEVESYRGGKVTLIGWFTGQVMKKMRGKADAALAKTILEELLK
jgi:aspartyl-tRNA(Asn)/glutamyl-tRNA(Gln) amidotransferase subunit B